MKYQIKLMSVALAAMLMFAGCAGGDTSWVFESGNIRIPAGLYIIFQTNAFIEAEQKISEENPEADIPEPQKMLSMTVEGQPASDWINAKASEAVREYVAVQQKFDSMGLTLNDAELAGIESSISSIKSQSGDFYEDNGISDGSIRDYYTGTARKNRLFLTLYGKGGEAEVPEDELKDYFKENYVIADVLPMMLPMSVPEGETRTLEELKADVKTAAEGYVEMLLAGTEFEQISYDWNLRNAEGAEKDSVKKPEKGDLTVIVSEQNRSSFGDTFTDAAFASKIGTPEIVEDDYFLLVIDRLDSLFDPSIFEGSKDALLQELKYSEFEEKLAGWGAEIQMETNSASVDRYKPSKIKFDQTPAA